MKKYILSCLLFTFFQLTAQAQFTYEVDKDPETGKTMFIGKCSFDDLSEEASFDWMSLIGDTYNPNSETVETLKKILPQYHFVIFMGTWCEDTRELLPKLYKTLLLSRCYTNYTMYALDRNKQSPAHKEQEYRVSNLPTIIVQKDGKEIGRIVETISEPIEEVLLKIVGGSTANK